MSATDPNSSGDRNPVERLAAEFLERRRVGESPSVEVITQANLSGNYSDAGQPANGRRL